MHAKARTIATGIKNINVSATSGYAYDLLFGFHPEATDDYDPDFDIYAPPPPPTEYFDAADSSAIDENDLLEEGKLSIVDVVGHNDFGSVLLRDLLYKIDKAKLLVIKNISDFLPKRFR